MNTLATAALVCSAAWGLCVWLLGRTIYRVGYEQGATDQARNDADNAQSEWEFVEFDEDESRELLARWEADMKRSGSSLALERAQQNELTETMAAILKRRSN